MPFQVVSQAIMRCPFGSSTSKINPTFAPTCKSSQKQMAVIQDHIPLTNIPTFGRCSCLGNPTVAAATAANKGTLTPMPCVPMTVAPWVPGSSTVMHQNIPALNSTSKLMCAWGGVITIVDPGQCTQFVP